MVSVKAHLRRLKSGKSVWVRSHVRRGPTATTSGRSDIDTSSGGVLWVLLIAVIVIGLVAGGVATMGNSSPVSSETRRASRSAPATPVKLPEGPEGRLAAQLRDARGNIGLSQKKVSELTGIAQSTINDFEDARAVPSAETLKALSNFYQLSLDEWSRLEIARVEIR